jgi:hypothetical protein
MGFDRLEKSETTPKLTSMLRRRPSHISETSCRETVSFVILAIQCQKVTLFVDALAFTTPWTSSGSEVLSGRLFSGDTLGVAFNEERRIHHSAPIVHSLS